MATDSIVAIVQLTDRTHRPDTRADLPCAWRLFDSTTTGALEGWGELPSRLASPSPGAALRAAARASDATWFLWVDPRTRCTAERLTAQLEAARQHPAARLITCDLQVVPGALGADAMVLPQVLSAAPTAPLPPLVESTFLLHRDALRELECWAFFPVLRRLHRTLLEAGQIAHVARPLVHVEPGELQAERARAAEDAALVETYHVPSPSGAPELTVALCTLDRKVVLAECIESFCRQQLPPGTFELSVVDNGSADGTFEHFGAMEFAIPVHLARRESSNLAAARQQSLEDSTAPLLLLVNDDTIAFPDLVAKHLAAHQASPEPRAILGTFEQPEEALETALMRVLEESHLTFLYAGMRAGVAYDWKYFWTCNLSVSRQRVLDVGGFDPSFEHYGCEDTDLGIRLHQTGMSVFFEPGARALHRHVLDFDQLRRRCRRVATAYVPLLRKHPRELLHSGFRWLGGLRRDYCQRRLQEMAGELQRWERAAAALAPMNLAALEGMGEAFRELIPDLQAALRRLLEDANQFWWYQGLIEGLDACGLASLSDERQNDAALEGWIQADQGDAPPYLATVAEPVRYLAWPRYDVDSDLDWLLQRLLAPLQHREEVCVCLFHDALWDGPLPEAMRRLRGVYHRHMQPGQRLKLQVVYPLVPQKHWADLGREVEAALRLPSSSQGPRQRWLEGLDVAVVSTERELALRETARRRPAAEQAAH